MAEGKVWIKRGREKPIRNRHPWVFSGAISRAEHAVDGELVTLVDHKSRFLARGYWNSGSQIQARVLSWQDEAIDDAWWLKMLSRAVARRCSDRVDTEKAARRLVNAENDFIPGLIIDRYADWYVLQALTRYIDNQKAAIAAALAEVTGARHIYERSDVEARKREGLPPAAGLLRGGPLPDLCGDRRRPPFSGGHQARAEDRFLSRPAGQSAVAARLGYGVAAPMPAAQPGCSIYSAIRAVSRSPPQTSSGCIRSMWMRRGRRLSWRSAISN